MNKLITIEKTEEIVIALLSGENPDTLHNKFKCDISVIFKIMASNVFSERVKEHLEKDILINGLAAVKNIKKIASEEGISKATQLKANQWLAEKSLEVNKLGHTESPATMTQDQLARRLKELQNEAIKRAVPIETGVIDQALPQSLDDMLD